MQFQTSTLSWFVDMFWKNFQTSAGYLETNIFLKINRNTCLLCKSNKKKILLTIIYADAIVYCSILSKTSGNICFMLYVSHYVRTTSRITDIIWKLSLHWSWIWTQNLLLRLSQERNVQALTSSATVCNVRYQWRTCAQKTQIHFFWKTVHYSNNNWKGR